MQRRRAQFLPGPTDSQGSSNATASSSNGSNSNNSNNSSRRRTNRAYHSPPPPPPGGAWAPPYAMLPLSQSVTTYSHPHPQQSNQQVPAHHQQVPAHHQQVPAHHQQLMPPAPPLAIQQQIFAMQQQAALMTTAPLPGAPVVPVAGGMQQHLEVQPAPTTVVPSPMPAVAASPGTIESGTATQVVAAAPPPQMIPTLGGSPPPCVRATEDLLREQRDPPRYLFEWTQLYDMDPAQFQATKKWNPEEAACAMAGMTPSHLEQVLGGQAQDGARIEKKASTATVNNSTKYLVPSLRQELDGPPSARSGHTSTYVSAMNSVMIYGGTSSIGGGEGYHSDIYQLEVHTGKWYQLETIGVAAPGTFGHTTSLMADGKTLFVYGGQGHNYVVGGYLWYLDLVSCAWTHKQLRRQKMPGEVNQVQESDLRRWGHSMVALPNEKKSMYQLSCVSHLNFKGQELFLLFAGMNEMVARNDLLVIDAKNAIVSQFRSPIPIQFYFGPSAGQPPTAPNNNASAATVSNAAGGAPPTVGGSSGAAATSPQAPPQRLEPQPRRRHTAFIYKENYLIIFGGRNLYKFLNDLWVLHLPTGVWVPVHKTTSPSSLRSFYSLDARCKGQYHLLTLELAKLLSFGELSASLSADHSLMAAPPPRTGHCGFMHKGHLYVVSGFEADGVYDDCYAYDVESNQWSAVSLGEEVNDVTRRNNAQLVAQGEEGERDTTSSSTRGQQALAHYKPRSMMTATLLPVSLNVKGESSTQNQNPAVLFFGGRNMVSLGDCFLLRVHSRTPSLFRFLSEFLIDNKDWCWDEGLMSRERCPASIRSDAIEMGGPPSSPIAACPPHFYQPFPAYPATPTG